MRYRRKRLVSDRANTEGRTMRSWDSDVTNTTKLRKVEIKRDSTDSLDPIKEIKSEQTEENPNDDAKKVKKSLGILESVAFRRNVVCLVNYSTAIPFSYTKSRFVCFLCQEGFPSSVLLKKHYKAEHETHRCDASDGVFKKLMKHKSLKMDIADLRCKLCQNPYSELKFLIDHIINDHDAEFNLSMRNFGILAVKLTDDDFQCHICGEKFVYFVKLVKHLNDSHMDKNYICEICGKSFNSYYSHQFHQHKHGPGFICPYCGKRCNSAACLKEHMASTHGKGTYKCTECPAEFISIYKRKKHILSVHNADDVPPSFKCPHCDKVFTCTSLRNVHVRKVHLQEKNEVCQICNAKLFNKTRLNLHMVKHLKERSHVCDICGKKYQWKKNLKLHMQKAHNVQ